MVGGNISRLELRPSDFEDYVDIFVDGELLARHLSQGQDADVFGKDCGIGWTEVDRAYVTVFDQEVLVSGTEQRAILFVCSGCNIVGCADTFATISTSDRHITLGQFAWPNRKLEHVPAVTFDRDQYIVEVERTNAWFAATYPDQIQRNREWKAIHRPKD